MCALRDCETGPTVNRPYPRRLISLTIFLCNYKGSPYFWVLNLVGQTVRWVTNYLSSSRQGPDSGSFVVCCSNLLILFLLMLVVGMLVPTMNCNWLDSNGATNIPNALGLPPKINSDLLCIDYWRGRNIENSAKRKNLSKFPKKKYRMKSSHISGDPIPQSKPSW